MGNITSACTSLSDLPKIMCCPGKKPESDVEKSEYTTSPSLTPFSSIATTVSKSTSDFEEILTWYDIDLPRIYRPLSTPLSDPETIYRFRREDEDRGTIIFIPDRQVNDRLEQTRKEVPGIHKSKKEMQRTLWTKTKDRIIGNDRRQKQIQSYLAKHKSDEVKSDVKFEKTSERPNGPRLRRGVLESDM